MCPHTRRRKRRCTPRGTSIPEPQHPALLGPCGAERAVQHRTLGEECVGESGGRECVLGDGAAAPVEVVEWGACPAWTMGGEGLRGEDGGEGRNSCVPWLSEEPQGKGERISAPA